MNRVMPFEWIVALRFLREGRMQTLFIISGVAIGVSVIIFMSALLTALQGNFIRRVLTAQAPSCTRDNCNLTVVKEVIHGSRR